MLTEEPIDRFMLQREKCENAGFAGNQRTFYHLRIWHTWRGRRRTPSQANREPDAKALGRRSSGHTYSQ